MESQNPACIITLNEAIQMSSRRLMDYINYIGAPLPLINEDTGRITKTELINYTLKMAKKAREIGCVYRHGPLEGSPIGTYLGMPPGKGPEYLDQEKKVVVNELKPAITQVPKAARGPLPRRVVNTPAAVTGSLLLQPQPQAPVKKEEESIWTPAKDTSLFTIVAPVMSLPNTPPQSYIELFDTYASYYRNGKQIVQFVHQQPITFNVLQDQSLVSNRKIQRDTDIENTRVYAEQTYEENKDQIKESKDEFVIKFTDAAALNFDKNNPNPPINLQEPIEYKPDNNIVGAEEIRYYDIAPKTKRYAYNACVNLGEAINGVGQLGGLLIHPENLIQYTPEIQPLSALYTGCTNISKNTDDCKDYICYLHFLQEDTKMRIVINMRLFLAAYRSQLLYDMEKPSTSIFTGAFNAVICDPTNIASLLAKTLPEALGGYNQVLTVVIKRGDKYENLDGRLFTMVEFLSKKIRYMQIEGVNADQIYNQIKGAVGMICLQLGFSKIHITDIMSERYLPRLHCSSFGVTRYENGMLKITILPMPYNQDTANNTVADMFKWVNDTTARIFDEMQKEFDLKL